VNSVKYNKNKGLCRIPHLPSS